jgi:hypothetical protein
MTMLLVLAILAASAAVAGTAISGRQRRCLRKAGPTFACRFWSLTGAGSGRWNRTNLRRARAVWIHDVLLVQRGGLFPRLLVLPVRLPDDSMRFARPGEVRGLTTTPLVMELRLDDGSLVAVAAAGRDRTNLAGPSSPPPSEPSRRAGGRRQRRRPHPGPAPRP